jgi:LDH2 family malate/lactate/ureidoglycolate dehydrogenase
MGQPEVARYPVERLSEFAAAVFVAHGVPAEDAGRAAAVLAAADLRGIDSHGIVRLPAYAEMLRSGRINPTPQITIVRESPGTALLDGDNGLGLVVAQRANELAIEKADAVGTSWVGVRHSNHFGIAGYYPLQTVERGLIGWALTNAPRLVAPTGGAARMLGTNPIALAVPGGEEPPVVIDLATSAAALGKVQLAQRAGKPIPTGWALDRDGNPTTDPAAVFDGGPLLPLGGADAGHKGYCLAALVDLVCGVLTGACWGPFVPTFMMRQETFDPAAGLGIGHAFGALRIDAFMDPSAFHRRVDDWVRALRATPPALGSPGVLIPGDPERQAEAERRANGVPLPAAVVAELRALAGRTGVAFD